MTSDLNFGDCIGCGLCILGCPAYEETGFDLLTARGRNKALQSGLAAEDMVEPIWACTLCGYCDAICPSDVHNVQIVLHLRRDLVQRTAANASSEAMRGVGGRPRARPRARRSCSGARSASALRTWSHRLSRSCGASAGLGTRRRRLLRLAGRGGGPRDAGRARGLASSPTRCASNSTTRSSWAYCHAASGSLRTEASLLLLRAPSDRDRDHARAYPSTTRSAAAPAAT